MFLNSACGIIKNPFRDYSSKPFNAREWRAGDTIERGRMVRNMNGLIFVDGNDKEDVLKLLGEPDEKEFKDGREVWLYRIDFKYETSMKYLPVTFDPRHGTFIGAF
jgi:hypothetical protein